MFKLKILVVLYNRLPIDSETIQSIIAAKNAVSHCAELILWDNSSCKLSDSELLVLDDILKGINYKYYADGNNTYLSVIYNRVINEINQDDYLLILDHDSIFDQSFFIELIQAISNNPNVNLFLPLILSHNKIVSPANNYYFYGSYWKKIKLGLIKTKRLIAINSGMTISGHYLKNKFVGYNEKIKFYGTDNDFMNNYTSDNEYLYVLNAKINHTLDFHDSKDLDNILKRFEDIKYGFFILTKSQGQIVYFLSKVYFFLYQMKLCINNRTIKFIFNS